MFTVEGAWKNVTPLCPCHGEERVVMEPQMGPHSMFYACPKYHPEARKEGERACNNRINLIEYEKMISRLADESAKAEMAGGRADLTNARWKDKGIEFRVASQNGRALEVEIRNVRAMR